MNSWPHDSLLALADHHQHERSLIYVDIFRMFDDVIIIYDIVVHININIE